MTLPKIFISATSGDLRSARQMAKDALLTINCHPVEQTNFEPDWRSVTDMLRAKISGCQALIHLAGLRYGAEPDPATLPAGTPRRSYTQMEYHLARELGLRVYTFLLPETYPYDVAGTADTPEQTQLQAAHRAFLQSSAHLYDSPGSDFDLRTRIIALQEKVIGLEQEQHSIAKEVKTSRSWGLWAAAAIILLLGGTGVWQWLAQQQTTEQVKAISQKQDEQTSLLKDQRNLLQEAVVELQQLTEEKAKLGIKITDLPRAEVEKELAARIGVSAVELHLNIEAGKKSQDALTRAHASLLAGQLADAHTAAKQVREAEAAAMQRVIQSYQVDAQAYYQEVRYEAALESYQKAAALVDKTADPGAWAEAQGWVAVMLSYLARHREAEPLLREIIRLREQHPGASQAGLATALNNLAQLLKATNRLQEAEPLMRQVLKMDEASHGPDHPEVATDLNNLALLLQATNRQEEAGPLLQRALKIDEASHGPKHPTVARDLNNLAQLLQDTNRLAEAEPLMQRALKIDEASHGPRHPTVAIRLSNLAQLLQATNRLAEAEPLLRRALEIDEASHGPDHPLVALRLSNLAQLLQATNRLAEAEPLMRRALKIDEASQGPEHPDVAIRLNNLATLLVATQRLAEAGPLSLRTVGILLRFQARTGHRHPHILTMVENYLLLARAMNTSDADIHTRLDRQRQEAGLEAAAFEEIWRELLAKHPGEIFQVVITDIVKGGQGEALGLQVGDIYVSYNGHAITRVDQLVRLAGEAQGEAIPLEVLRDDKKLTFTAKPGKFGTAIQNRRVPVSGAGSGAEPAK